MQAPQDTQRSSSTMQTDPEAVIVSLESRTPALPAAPQA